jgi:hypothetical protein
MEKIMSFKIQAVEKAVVAYEQIKEAFSRPDKAVTGEALILYGELSDWGFFDKYNISEPQNKWLYVTVMAMSLTSRTKTPLSFSKNEEGKSKWEIIQSALQKSEKFGTSKKKA